MSTGEKRGEGVAIPADLRDTLHVIEGHLDVVSDVLHELNGMRSLSELLATDSETIGEILGGHGA